jgi:hypothetical protein
MHGIPSANFDGDRNGAHGAARGAGDAANADIPSLDKGSFSSRSRSHAEAESADSPPSVDIARDSKVVSNTIPLTRETPFGITAIVGGTNVRFCLSTPYNSKPIEKKVTWRELKNELGPGLEAQGLKFEDSKDIVLAEIAKRFAAFVAEQFPEEGGHPPFHNICAFDLSVAGLVEGEGPEALVTTTNTGINLKGEALALGLISAINGELTQRSWPTIPHASTAVLNDATAGTLGEYYAGSLKGVDNGLFVIFGTGVGSMAIVNGKPYPKFSELGHSVIVHFEHLSKKRFTVHDGTQTSQMLDEHGNFKTLPRGNSYIENSLAGPWFAINFVRKLIDDRLTPVLKALASKLLEKMKPEEKETMRAEEKQKLTDEEREAIEHLKQGEADKVLLSNALFRLGDRTVSSRQRWAIDSSSALITAINKHILIPDALAAYEATPCTGKSDEWLAHAAPEDVLTYLAWVEHWKTYFKEMGEALGAVYKQMKHDGVAPKKIVLGGGIAEACQENLSDGLKAYALRLIHDHGHLPKETVVFSAMSPEARESAVTLKRVNQVYDYWLEHGEWESLQAKAAQ